MRHLCPAGQGSQEDIDAATPPPKGSKTNLAEDDSQDGSGTKRKAPKEAPPKEGTNNACKQSTTLKRAGSTRIFEVQTIQDDTQPQSLSQQLSAQLLPDPDKTKKPASSTLRKTKEALARKESTKREREGKSNLGTSNVQAPSQAANKQPKEEAAQPKTGVHQDTRQTKPASNGSQKAIQPNEGNESQQEAVTKTKGRKGSRQTQATHKAREPAQAESNKEDSGTAKTRARSNPDQTQATNQEACKPSSARKASAKQVDEKEVAPTKTKTRKAKPPQPQEEAEATPTDQDSQPKHCKREGAKSHATSKASKATGKGEEESLDKEQREDSKVVQANLTRVDTGDLAVVEDKRKAYKARKMRFYRSLSSSCLSEHHRCYARVYLLPRLQDARGSSQGGV